MAAYQIERQGNRRTRGLRRACACSISRPPSPVRIARGCWPTWAPRSSRSKPAEGETMRTRPPVRNGCSTVFGQLNVGKKSLVLDLKSPRRQRGGPPAGRERGYPGREFPSRRDAPVEARLWHRCSALNPKLIYCSISGYGQTGPSAELPAYAPVIHAASGYDMAHLAYQPGRSRPDYCGIYHADVVTGTYAFGAICVGALSAHGDRARPAYRRLDAGIDADLDPERGAVVAIRGERSRRGRCSGRSRRPMAMS